MVILGLGSNSGDRQAHLTAAVRKLAALLKDMRLSRVLESKALLLPGAPAEFDRPYFNMVVRGETSLPPLELLAEIKSIEQALGRIDRGRWAPREIDIDLLAMDELVLNAPGLIIPHPELLNRDFALVPLMDVAPEWRFPGGGMHQGRTASEIARIKGFSLGKQLHDAGIKIHA